MTSYTMCSDCFMMLWKWAFCEKCRQKSTIKWIQECGSEEHQRVENKVVYFTLVFHSCILSFRRSNLTFCLRLFWFFFSFRTYRIHNKEHFISIDSLGFHTGSLYKVLLYIVSSSYYFWLLPQIYRFFAWFFLTHT